MIEKKPYQKTELATLKKESEDLLSSLYDEEIKTRMMRTIEVEGPIRRSLLYKRVLNSFSLVKVGSRLLSLFDRLSSEIEVLITEDYDGESIFHNGEREDFFRPSPNACDRYSYQIPSSEAASCILYILENSEKPSMTKSQLYREFIKEMGWEKSGRAIEEIFNSSLLDSRIKRSGNGRFLK